PVLVALDVFGALAGHLHVAAQRQRANAVFGIASAEAEDRGIEPELKLEDADADTLGRQEMPQLVDEHQHAQNERKRQKSDQAGFLRPSILPRARALENTHEPI